jgi:hypothetical protein
LQRVHVLQHPECSELISAIFLKGCLPADVKKYGEEEEEEDISEEKKEIEKKVSQFIPGITYNGSIENKLKLINYLFELIDTHLPEEILRNVFV